MSKRRPSGPPRPVAASDGRMRGAALLGLSTLLVAAPLLPAESAAGLGIGIPAVLLWFALLLIWWCGMLLRPETPLRWGGSGSALGVFLTFHSISALLAAPEGHARAVWNSLWQWWSLGLCFLLVRNLVRSPREARILVVILLALAAAQTAFAHYQYFVTLPQTRREYWRNPERALADAGIVAPAGSALRRQFEDRLNSSEPVGTFALTNSLAAYLAPWLIVAISLTLPVLYAARPSRRAQSGAIVAALALASCLLLTKSRTAWLAVLVGVALLLLYGRQWGWKPGWRWLLGLGGGLLGAVLVAWAAGGLDRLVLSESAKSVRYRLEYWQSAWQMILDHPLGGCGPGKFQTCYTLYKLPQASETIADPHNFLLEIWATAGTLSAFAFLAFLATVALEFCPVRREAAAEPAAAPLPPAEHVEMGVVWSLGSGVPLGFATAVLLGWISGFPLDTAMLWMGVLPCGLVAGLLYPWVRRGSLPVFTLAIPLGVTLLCLSAVGGISFPGVSQTVWVLAALAPLASGRNVASAPLSRGLRLLVLAAILVLAGAFLKTAFYPVIGATARLQEAQILQLRGLPARARSACLAAAEADPWSAEPWVRLAALDLGEFLATGAPRARQALREDLREMLAREPQSHRLRQQAGEWLVQAFKQRRDRELLRAARDHFEAATILYPHHAHSAAWLALVEAQLENPGAARRAAEAALRWDAANPHQEQKLARLALPDLSSPAAADVKAEPRMLELRTPSLRTDSP